MHGCKLVCCDELHRGHAIYLPIGGGMGDEARHSCSGHFDNDISDHLAVAAVLVGAGMKGFVYISGVANLELDQETCVGCGMCVEVCPHRVFVMEGSFRIGEWLVDPQP